MAEQKDKSLKRSTSCASSKAATPNLGTDKLECFAVYCLDSSLWSTAQVAMPWGEDEFSQTWPPSGTMRNGVVSAPQKSGPPSGASEPTSSRGDLYQETHSGIAWATQVYGPRGEKMKLNPNWYETLLGLPAGFTAGLPRPKRRRAAKSPHVSSSSTTT